DIHIDGKMTEPGWSQALTVSPFFYSSGEMDSTSVKILNGHDRIYLFCSIRQPDGITSTMKEPDNVIVADDYVQVNLKPWLPDSIIHGRDYSYSIAVNPDGLVWDSYLDPYLGGYFFSSWNSNVTVATQKGSGHWLVEMAIPYSGLDVTSDPGMKWNLEFAHSTFKDGKAEVSNPNFGITLQQDVQVREAGLVSYYWTRDNFLMEVKPDLNKQEEKSVRVSSIGSIPKIDGSEDSEIWTPVNAFNINHTDKMGKLLTSDKATAIVALSGNTLCFDLQADGAKIEKKGSLSTDAGDGMASQMAGVNGVYVDQTLFQNESFWIILQPGDIHADCIHQGYYMVVINNSGGVRGMQYDEFGAPLNDWTPKADVDFYNTSSGWGAEVMLDLKSFDIPATYSDTWGLNIFRNRLLKNKESELQAWKYTAGNFLAPESFGKMQNVKLDILPIFRASLKRKGGHLKSILSNKDSNTQLIREFEGISGSINRGSLSQLIEANAKLTEIDYALGVYEATELYDKVPHPVGGKLPLMDIQFVEENGWAVGAMGTILRTRGGGESWEKIPLNSIADFYRVKFINKNQGWIAGGRIRIADTNESMRHDERGGYGYIYHTRDGGETWECQFAERGRHLFALDFVDGNIGYACGERGFLIKTVDGGKTWKELNTTGTLNWLYGMTFIDKNAGFAVGQNETVIKTIDGGKTWEHVKADADRKFYGFRPIYRDIAFNGNTGCIVGQNGTIVVSHDGGESWSPSATFYKNSVRELMDLRSVKFVTAQHGYAVGELGNRIMVTEDGGRNWVYRDTGQSGWLRALYAGPSGRLYAVGERENIMKSSDQGLSWIKQHGVDTKADILLLMAHGDDAPILLNTLISYYAINEGKQIVDVGVMSDTHSSEYEETYNLEHDRNAWMIGAGAASNFSQFETGNNGANYYHFNQRLWEGEDNIAMHMVAAIRAFRPDIVITHGGIYGDYDKPGHKVSGRAGLKAFETAGGDVDCWPELTRLGLKPWQPKKLYCYASQSYPETVYLSWIADQPVKGTDMTCKEFGEYVLRNFQSQGVHLNLWDLKLCLVKSVIKEPEHEKSIFDGL
ncbi:MAG: YCF48-related protein, partial [Mangrovibacterium sp.]|nr:YCF48-related protein [Mangrovibacterium sp.]